MWRSPFLLIAIVAGSLLPAGFSFGPSSCAAATPAELDEKAGELLAESEHFVVTSYRGGPHARDTASRCEAICAGLRRDSLGHPEPIVWQSKCRVILHSTRIGYRRATGQGSGQTVGSSVITFRDGRVMQRRIDLLAENVDQALSALPHEMTHVLLADVFPTSPPPKWAEEGLALLSDPVDKRARHARDLRHALQTNTMLPLASFFLDTEYPPTGDRGVFYAQSMSLAGYLVELDSPQRFVEFVELSQDVGHIAALQRVYDIRGLEELESQWLRYAAAKSATRGGAAISR